MQTTQVNNLNTQSLKFDSGVSKKDNISYNQNIHEYIINRDNTNTTKINKHLKISTY